MQVIKQLLRGEDIFSYYLNYCLKLTQKNKLYKTLAGILMEVLFKTGACATGSIHNIDSCFKIFSLLATKLSLSPERMFLNRNTENHFFRSNQ